MRLPMAVLAFSLSAASVAFAQTAEPDVAAVSSGGRSNIKSLLASGYEIKSSVPNGKKFIVFMQKDKSAYACEFATVAQSRCESLN